MVCDAMFSHAPAPRENIHPVPTEGVSLDEAAEQYQKTLQQLYGSATLDPRPAAH